MKWHDYRLAYKAEAAAAGISKPTPLETATALFRSMQRVVPDGNPVHMRNTGVQLQAEAAWVEDDRPYYDLYPSVAEAFCKIDLDRVKCSQLVLPLDDLLVRMPVGQELDLSPRTKFRAVLIHQGRAAQRPDGAGRGWLLSIDTGDVLSGRPDIPIHTVIGIRMPDDGTLMESLLNGRRGPGYEDAVDSEAVENVCRIITTLCLLKGDPDLIEPQPLEADRQKWERTHDPALIQKAAKRGKRGWSVGAHIETAPGFRRPHFAIRWMGKGRVDPRLRPIKGCLVHRKRIEEVPTDWLGPELTPLQNVPHAAQ